MGYLVDARTDVLSVPGDKNGATVTFRADATWDDEQELARRTQEFRDLADVDERNARFRAQRTLLMIEGWTLIDAHGEPLPLIEHTLRRGLHRRVAGWLEQESVLRYEGRPEEEEGPFDGRSPQLSTATT